MKLEIGRHGYDVPPHDTVWSAVIDDREFGGALYAIRRVSLTVYARMFDENPNLVDRPDVFAVDNANNRIYFHPAPDKAYAARIRLTPPVIEI